MAISAAGCEFSANSRILGIFFLFNNRSILVIKVRSIFANENELKLIAEASNCC